MPLTQTTRLVSKRQSAMQGTVSKMRAAAGGGATSECDDGAVRNARFLFDQVGSKPVNVVINMKEYVAGSVFLLANKGLLGAWQAVNSSDAWRRYRTWWDGVYRPAPNEVFFLAATPKGTFAKVLQDSLTPALPKGCS